MSAAKWDAYAFLPPAPIVDPSMGGLGIGTWSSGSTVGPAAMVGSGRVGNFLKLGFVGNF